MSGIADSTTFYGYAELGGLDGDDIKYDGVRVTLASKIAYERTARVKKWPGMEDNIFTFGAYLAWHAGKLAGLHSLKWEDFLDHAVDAGVDVPDDDEPAEEDDADRPTDAANTTMPQ